MARDKVEIQIQASGAQKAAAEVGKVNKAIKEGGKTAKQSASSWREVKEAVASLKDAAGGAKPGVDNLVSAIEGGLSASSIAAIGVTTLTAAVASLGAAAYLTASRYAAVVNDIEDKTGVTGQAASAWVALGQTVGMSGEDMSMMFTMLSRTAVEAAETIREATEAGEDSTDAFSKWGIAITDANGALLPTDQIMRNIWLRHRELSNGIEKTRMEMELFGRSGAKTNDLLNLTDERAKEILGTMQATGNILDSEVTQRFEDLDQQLNLVKASFEGSALILAESMLPALEWLAETARDTALFVSDVTKAINEMVAQIPNAVKEMGVLADVAMFVARNFSGLVSSIWHAIDALKAWNGGGGVSFGGDGGGGGSYGPYGQEPVPIALPENQTGVTKNYTKTAPSGGGAKDSNLENYIIKAQAEIDKLTSTLNTKILGQTGSALEIAMGGLNDEIAKWQTAINEANEYGIDTSGVENLIEKYRELKTVAISREDLDTQHQMLMESLQADYDLRVINADQLRALQKSELVSYKQGLQQLLNDEKLTAQERLRIRKELSNATKEIEELGNNDAVEGLRNALREMQEMTIDYKGSYLQVFKSIENGFTGLMDGVVTGQKSLSDNLKNAWEDIANTIINQLWKVAMEMIVIKPLFSWLGNALGGGLTAAADGGLIIPTSHGAVKKRARGGGTSGWTLVGERGPELIDFQSPGRVYTAEQTAAALGGGGALQNVTVQIENKSGTELEATTANVSYDPSGYIIGVVLNAVSTNRSGMRDILRGAGGASR